MRATVRLQWPRSMHSPCLPQRRKASVAICAWRLIGDCDDLECIAAGWALNLQMLADSMAEHRLRHWRMDTDAAACGIGFVGADDAVRGRFAPCIMQRHPGAEKHA